jgi:hypothetical protein
VTLPRRFLVLAAGIVGFTQLDFKAGNMKLRSAKGQPRQEAIDDRLREMLPG